MLWFAECHRRHWQSQGWCELALASYLLATLRQRVPDKEPDKVR